MKPRFGLMRGRQFLMKDLYCFDLDDKSALETYELVCNAYDKIFETVGLKTVKGNKIIPVLAACECRLQKKTSFFIIVN